MGTKLNARLRIMVLWPQAGRQSLEADQSPQEQNIVASQRLVQLDISLALRRSHIWPQWFGICTMERCRDRCPPHLVHCPQSDHRPQRQSVQSSMTHGTFAQGSVTDMTALQGSPPSLGRLTSWRLRSRCPPPHDRVQDPHRPHWDSSQSRGVCTPHSAEPVWFSMGLHGAVSLSDVLVHALPLPEANVLI